VFPLVVGFAIYSTVVSTEGIAPSTAGGIPTHLTPYGELLHIKYLEVILVVIRVAVVPLLTGAIQVIRDTIVSAGTALSMEFVL
jgi:hypothetical protein